MAKAIESERVTCTLPWEGADPQAYPYEMRHWLPHLPTGGFHVVDEEFEVEGQGRDRVVYNRGPIGKLPRDGGPDLITYGEMRTIFEVSADRGISLMDALLVVKGEDTMAPVWVEKAKEAPKQYADPKYRTGVEPAPKAQVSAAKKSKRAPIAPTSTGS